MYRTDFLYEFYIGKPFPNTGQFSPQSSGKVYDPKDASDFVRDTDDGKGNGYLIQHFDMNFNGNMSGDNGSTGSCTVTFMNLDDEIVDYFLVNSGNNLVAMLKVGDNIKAPERLFSGTVVDVSDDFSTETRKTVIKFVDGKVNIQLAGTVRNFPAGTPTRKVVQSLAEDMQMPINNLDFIQGSLSYSESIYGKTFTALKRVCKNMEIDFSIVDGTVNIIPKGLRKRSEVAFLASHTGLMQASRAVKDTKTKEGKTETTRSVKVRFLLDPSIKPNETIWVNTPQIDAAFKVKSCRYTGGTRTTPTCDADLVQVEGVIE